MNLREQIEKEITDKVMTKLASERVELGLVQDILKDTETMRNKLNSLTNKASKLSSDYDKVIKMAKTVGVEMDSKFIDAGKFIKKVENIK